MTSPNEQPLKTFDGFGDTNTGGRRLIPCPSVYMHERAHIIEKCLGERGRWGLQPRRRGGGDVSNTRAHVHDTDLLLSLG